VGDGKAYIGALIVLDPDIAPSWAAQNGSTATTLAELAVDPIVIDEITRNVRDANAQFNQAERIKRWAIVSEDWEPDSDLMTPTMKLKRRGIHARYATEIEALFK
jgi:long-chain acyl-CoA synthetase